VYVRLKSVVSNHFVLSSTVPIAEGGISGDEEFWVLGTTEGPVEILAVGVGLREVVVPLAAVLLLLRSVLTDF